MSTIGSEEGTSQVQEDVEQGKKRTEEELKLYKAALEGDWGIAQAIYNLDREKANAAITNRGETALHMAALAGHTHFVKNLVKLMSEDGLAHETHDGKTAFYYAVITGKGELAEAIMEKKKDLVWKDGKSFLISAAVLGHRDLVELVYRYNKDKLSDEDRKDLLVRLIGADMYDIALDMLKEHANVAAVGLEGTKAADDEYIKNAKRTTTITHTSATTVEYNAHVEGTKILKGTEAAENEKRKNTPLLALARKRYRSRKGSHQSRFIQSQNFFCFICNLIKYTCKFGFSNAEHEQNLTKDIQKAEQILQCIWTEMVLKDRGSGPLDDFHFKPIFLAAEQGNVEFLTILVNKYPDILFKRDENKRTIIHVAVLHRQEKIFELIHEFGEVKNLINMYIDTDDNNMLHLAGKLAPPDRLGAVPGAALQVDFEIMWFEKVNKVVKPWFSELKNKDGLTPGNLFEREHKKLMNEGEKWMKGTAKSCTLVATLIATVVFAAAFTVPGGNGLDTGIPILLNEALFIVFIIFDTISLIFSISSVVTFLSILTSRFRLHDFRVSLRCNLIRGLSFLLFSTVAMMVAFVAAFFLAFKHGRLLFVSIPLAVLSLLPVVLLVVFYLRLCRDLNLSKRVPLFPRTERVKRGAYQSKTPAEVMK